MQLKYTAEGMAEFKAWLTKAGQAISTKVPNDVMQTIVNDGVQYMQSKCPVDTGYLRSTIEGHVTGGGNAVINVSAYYAGFVNYGTRYMDAQPFFTDGIEYINGRVRDIMIQQVLAQLRK